MADPFSIAAGAVGVADVTLKLVQFLRRTKAGTDSINEDIDGLLHELEAIWNVNELIEKTFSANIPDKVGDSDADENAACELWRTTGNALKDCTSTLDDLHALLVKVLGQDEAKTHSKIRDLHRYFRMLSKEEDFNKLRRRLSTHQAVLRTMLTALNITETRISHASSDQSFYQLSEKIQGLGDDLVAQIASLKGRFELGGLAPDNFNAVLASAKATVPLASLNKHFDIPQAVSSIYTGRKRELENLRSEFLSPVPEEQSAVQKRFVIFGLGGSGKTQFCCKFAQENRRRFWGIFWVDASSSESIKQSYARIAKIDRIDPNERAVNSWLSSKEDPWLLIIDNVDDERIPVEHYFPSGEGGLILITTRNPALKTHGTFGPRFYHFIELGENDSSDLLLRAAGEPTPWNSLAYQSAISICEALGYLPLALIQAGKAVLRGLCTLQDYLHVFEMNRNSIRRRRSSIARGYGASESDDIIYSSYEITFDGLKDKRTEASKDAVDLLKIFCFFHRHHIRLDIFLQAGKNPRLEAMQPTEPKPRLQTSHTPIRSQSWAEVAKEYAVRFLAFLVKIGDRPVLPELLRDGNGGAAFDEFRLRAALKELLQMSLIYFDRATQSYSMHPLIHLWVRERPEMSLMEQAVWCQAAATVLAQAILLPPLGGKEVDEDFRRDVLPHVDHVQKQHAIIRATIEQNQVLRSRPWPPLRPQLNGRRAIQLVKFSLVYAQSGLWDKALTLQEEVVDFAVAMLGTDHPRTIDAMLFMTRTYFQLGRGDDAADLQRRMLDTCLLHRGETDEKTLQVMDALGGSEWQRGKFQDALQLHQRAVKGFTKLYGRRHLNTLRAMGNLGRVLEKFFRFDEAIDILEEAVGTMLADDALGPAHLDTLVNIDNLAMAIFGRYTYDKGTVQDLERALRMENEVFLIRKKRLGKEHPYTLWAQCNVARIKAAHGDVVEAEGMIRSGLVVVERNLGASHIGTLYGKAYLGQILTLAENYQEAESILRQVIRAHEPDGDRMGHPDLLVAVALLIRCYKLQGKDEEAAPLRDQFVKGIRVIYGADHPWERYFEGRYSSYRRTYSEKVGNDWKGQIGTSPLLA